MTVPASLAVSALRYRGRTAGAARDVLVQRHMVRALEVLLVDDDELSILNLRRALRLGLANATVIVASDGRDGLDRLLDRTFVRDRLVVITDLHMPRMSGLELVAAMRAEPRLRALPVVVLTRSTDEDERRAAFALGVAAYFLKSSDPSRVGEILACLGRHSTAPCSADGPV